MDNNPFGESSDDDSMELALMRAKLEKQQSNHKTTSKHFGDHDSLSSNDDDSSLSLEEKADKKPDCLHDDDKVPQCINYNYWQSKEISQTTQ